MEESFEDLLLKYKQIQLELESIRHEEKKALKPSEDSPRREEEAGAATPAPAGTEGTQPQGAVSSTLHSHHGLPYLSKVMAPLTVL